jgi:ubiquinone/menaquinone biosynthesis C-methylase UbiE
MALKRVDYNQHQHRVYAAGRVMDEDAKAEWMQRFAAHLPAERPLPLIDLGAGIGRLTPALAETFGGPVWGVEPSDRMREIAISAGPRPGLSYLAGEAARIPLPDASAAGVLMYLSFHHVPDRPAAAIEIARVLRPGGRLLLVSGFRERLGDGSWWHQFFPRARLIEREMFPSLAEVTEVFGAVGLKPLEMVEAPVRFWNSVAEAAERLRLKPFSTFEHLSEDEIAEGFERLDAAVAAETTPTPIVGEITMLVLG